MKKRLLFVAALLLSTAAWAGAYCQIDNSSAYFTGATMTDSATGKFLYEYRCTRGHTFWSSSAP